MEHGSGDGMEAIVLSLTISGGLLGSILVLAAILGHWLPRARLFYLPMNVAILAGQVIDGVTTWIGVENPFGLDLPPYRETVFISSIILDVFGGIVYLSLKLLLGIFVVLALGAAWEMAKTEREKAITLLVQLTLVVIGAIPVWNNMSNFLQVA